MINKALYLAANKNNDDLHSEIIEYDPEFVAELLERAKRVVDAQYPPKKLSEIPSWFECKWCPNWKVCHTDALPNRNCRTCIQSTAIDNGEWICEKYNKTLSKDEQLKACPDHRHFPHLVGFDLIATDGGVHTYANGYEDRGI